MRFKRDYNDGMLAYLTVASNGDSVYFACHEMPTRLDPSQMAGVTLEREEALKAYHELGRLLGIKQNE